MQILTEEQSQRSDLDSSWSELKPCHLLESLSSIIETDEARNGATQF